MSKHDGMVPTLLLGLGGIGGRLVGDMYDSMTPEQKEYTSAVCIDTNRLDLGKLEKKGVTTIQISSSKTVEEYITDNPEIKFWFPENPFIAIKKMTEGAGQIRACSRLAAEACIREGGFDKLDAAIKRVRSVTGDPNLPDLKVIIINSICGGTGAGLCVQIPYYIKHKLDYVAGAKSILFRGYFIGPSITEAKNTPFQKDANYTNAYSCVKELNAIYKLQNDVDGAKKLNIPFFDEANAEKSRGDAIEVPYDFIFMFEDFNADGLSTGGFEQQLENISQAIYTQCFSTVTGSIYSGEDNFIIPRIENSGMDRFGGMAMCKASYPYVGMLDYVAKRWVADSAVSSWNAIDNEYNLNLKIANRQFNGRGVDEIGTLSDFYINKIENADFSSKYRKYYDQTHIVSTQRSIENGAETRVEKPMIDSVVTLIEIESKKIRSDKIIPTNAYKVDRKNSANTNYDEAISFMSNIKKNVPGLINKYSLSIVNKLIPLYYEQDILNSANDESLAAMLMKLHPIAARYFLYSLKKKVDEKAKKLKSLLSSDEYSKEGQNKIENTDYYPRTEKKETPAEAEEIVSRHIPDFIVEHLPSDKEIYTRLQKAADDDYTTVINYARFSVQLNVYNELSNRLAILIDIYEKLFGSIGHIGKKSEDEANAFLYMHNSDKTTRQYICASFDNKLALYNEVVDSACINFSDIPDEAIHSLTASIYKIMVSQIEETGKKYNPDKISREMEKLFNKTVVSAMIDVVAEKTQSILNMNIIEAIKKQYWLNLDKDKRPESYTAVKLDDVDTIITSISTKATPQLKYTTDKTSEQRIYWILNPDSFTAKKQEEYEDENGKRRIKTEYYFDSAKADTVFNIDENISSEVFDDEKVDKYSLTCLRTVYCINASQMNIYKRGGRAYKAYTERINKILGIGKSDDVMSANNSLSFAHPHIDKNWHIPSVLPALDPSEEEERQTNIVLAFLLGVALRICRITKDNTSGGEVVDRWMFYNLKNGDYQKILVSRSPIGRNYSELLKAFTYNAAMVANVLEAEKYVKVSDIENCSRKNYSDLKQHRIIYSLTHTNEGKDEFDTENILMSLLKLYTESTDDVKLQILLKTLRKYMYDYALKVTGDNSEADIFYASMRRACISSFESVYSKLTASSTKGKAFERMSYDEAFIRNSKKTVNAFKQMYNTYL